MKANTTKPDRPQYHRAFACVTAQQYYSATSVSLRFHSRKRKLGVRFKNILSFQLVF